MRCPEEGRTDHEATCRSGSICVRYADSSSTVIVDGLVVASALQAEERCAIRSGTGFAAADFLAVMSRDLVVVDTAPDEANPLLSFQSESEIASARRASKRIASRRRRLAARRRSWLRAVRARYTACLKSERLRHEVLRWTVSLSLFLGGVVVGGLMAAPDAGTQPRVDSTAPAVPALSSADKSVTPPSPADSNVTGTAGTTVTVAEDAPPVVTPEPKPVAPRVRGHRGTLVVNSTPRGAEVFVNNRLAGRTPLVIRSEPAGSRAIRLSLDGYRSWSRGVNVIANRSTTVTARLNRED